MCAIGTTPHPVCGTPRGTAAVREVLRGCSAVGTGVAAMTLGSLFSGIAGLDLGLVRALDCEPRWFCEAEPWCRDLLADRHPGVPVYSDVRELGDGLELVDVLAGGFPCQNVSLAGRGEGLDGDRSGLWFEMARVIGLLRPRWVVAENVLGLLRRGLDRVLAGLHAIGYAAEWDVIEAAAVGAHHLRPRVFIVAYPDAQDAPVVYHDRGEIVHEAWERNRAALWASEPAGVPRTVWRSEMAPSERRARLKALGNAVVPQAAEAVGRYIATAQPVSGPLGQAFAHWDGGGWSMPQADLFAPSTPFTDGLPKAGAMRGGVLYEREPMVEPGAAKAKHARADAIFGRTLPTPSASTYGTNKSASEGAAVRPGPDMMARRGLWPTATASDGNGAGHSGQGGPNLRTAVARRMFPTPTAMDHAGGRRATARQDGWTSNPGTTLTDAVQPEMANLYPTPTVTEAKGARGEGSFERGGGQGLTRAVRTRDTLWPTPRSAGAGLYADAPEVHEARRGRSAKSVAYAAESLANAVEAERADSGRSRDALWATPRASDHRSGSVSDEVWQRNSRPLCEQVARAEGQRASAEPGERPQLNPVWTEWLMGFPRGWTAPPMAKAEPDAPDVDAAATEAAS